MSYNAEISRNNPGCFLFLVDQSASMMGALGGQPGNYKHEQAAAALNRTLSEIVQRCSLGEEIRDYFHVGIITYNTTRTGAPLVITPFEDVGPAAPFRLASEVETAAEVTDRPVKASDGKGGLIELIEAVPEWLVPEASGATPMCEALALAKQALEQWVSEHPESFPPIVINISDGAATDGNPVPIATDIMNVATQDGDTLLFNVHLSDVSALPVMYPGDEGRTATERGLRPGSVPDVLGVAREQPQAGCQSGHPSNRPVPGLRLQQRSGCPGPVPGDRHQACPGPALKHRIKEDLP